MDLFSTTSGVELTDYQRETVQFCLDREESPLYQYFWQTRVDACNRTWYYCPTAKEARVKKPTVSFGAAICEDMGMGKTVEVIATILAGNRRDGPDAVKDQVNLMLVPESIKNQTFNEFQRHAPSLKTVVLPVTRSDGAAARYDTFMSAVDGVRVDLRGKKRPPVPHSHMRCYECKCHCQDPLCDINCLCIRDSDSWSGSASSLFLLA